ncbi:hypothetical protein [Scandinavium manionii]|uniref:hypothetical protein n=1 Tax=Scandinavium manionii TaxID=2926520 RepID=UPI00135AA439|nr:hypothetical protein [Scandinavium manionii]MCS2167158.1 YebW family protein [Scandinavium manionii]
MYGLVLIISFATGATQSNVIGAYSSLAQCEAASQSHPSDTHCAYIDPDKGLLAVKPKNNDATQS